MTNVILQAALCPLAMTYPNQPSTIIPPENEAISYGLSLVSLYRLTGIGPEKD